jgi:putative ABC transport system substrate-binding protein
LNHRRKLLIALGITAYSPQCLFAQAKKPLVVIGWLHLSSRESELWQLSAFKEGLAAQGYKEGQQYVIEERWAEGRPERMQALAEELAAKKPAVIVPAFAIPASAAVKAAPGTPIIVVGADPWLLARVDSLARPGGMITGLTYGLTEVREKYIEFLVAAVPTLKRIGVLHYGNPPAANITRSKDAVLRFAASRAIEVRFEGVIRPEEIESAVSRLATQGTQALVVFPNALFLTEATRIAKLAQSHRWPLVGSLDLTAAGGLMGYGPDRSAIFRRAAWYVDRIIKGTKPGDLPIEQPMTFEFVVNLKTAKTLSLTLPPEIMVRATRVIE